MAKRTPRSRAHSGSGSGSGTRGRRKQKSGVASVLATLAIVVFLTTVAWERYSEANLQFPGPMAFFRRLTSAEDSGPRPEQAPAPVAAVAPAPVPAAGERRVLSMDGADAGFMGDPRWAAALADASEGARLIEAAERWRVDVGGDPFEYRARIQDGRRKVDASLDNLQALKTAFADSPTAQDAINRKIDDVIRGRGGVVK
ncbi:MAG TPA: hypothetical protein VGC54_05165 [Planctomycetota bacterium]